MNRTLHILLTAISCLAMAVSTTYMISAIVPAILLVVIYIIFRSSVEQTFATLLCISYFSACFMIGSLGVFFILPMVATMKFYPKCHYSQGFTVAFLIFLFIFSYLEIQYSTPGRLLERVSYLCCFFSFIGAFNVNDYNHKNTTFLLLFTLLIVNIFAIIMSGGISQFLVESAVNIRMGDADMDKYQNDTLDGSMGFPIHTIVMLSLSLPILMGNATKIFYKVIISSILIAMVFVTFLTTSKVYLLGLMGFALCTLPVIFKKSGGVIVLFFIIIFAVLNTQDWFVEMVYSRYILRIGDDATVASSGRDEIFASCIKYLIDNPLAIIFGLGYDSYIEIGRLNKLEFQQSAHNIILDALMGFGMLGCVLMVKAANLMRRKISSTLHIKSSLLSWTPFICWFLMCQTNTAFWLPKTYFIIPYLIIHTVCYKSLLSNEEY